MTTAHALFVQNGVASLITLGRVVVLVVLVWINSKR
jgi:hypothetical protein